MGARDLFQGGGNPHTRNYKAATERESSSGFARPLISAMAGGELAKSQEYDENLSEQSNAAAQQGAFFDNFEKLGKVDKSAAIAFYNENASQFGLKKINAIPDIGGDMVSIKTYGKSGVVMGFRKSDKSMWRLHPGKGWKPATEKDLKKIQTGEQGVKARTGVDIGDDLLKASGALARVDKGDSMDQILASMPGISPALKSILTGNSGDRAKARELINQYIATRKEEYFKVTKKTWGGTRGGDLASTTPRPDSMGGPPLERRFRGAGVTGSFVGPDRRPEKFSNPGGGDRVAAAAGQELEERSKGRKPIGSFGR